MSEDSRPQMLYQISGEAGQQFNIIGLRDRIRSGILKPEDQIAVVGTDLWKPASEYAVLTRYFSLVRPAEGIAAAVRSPQPPAGSMGSRIASGLVYPFTSASSIGFMVLAAGAALVMPLLSIVVALLGSVYALGVIRKSSEGQTSPPSIAEVGGPLEWILGVLQIVAVSLISAWPVILVMVLAFMGLMRSMILIGIALIVMMLYYPASLASVAVWKSVRIALSVQQIFRFIGILGADYYAVIGMWILTFIVIGFGTTTAGRVLGRNASLLLAINVGASLWSTFYASHLLGWAVHRHREQL